MTDETCPNGCDLSTFGTHAGPPDCDLGPADPGAILATGRVYGPDGQARTVEVAIPSGPIADAVRADSLRGVSIAPSRYASGGILDPFAADAPAPVLPWTRRPEPAEPIEFAVAPREPAVRVTGLPAPADLPEPVEEALATFAIAVREAFGIGVEVTAEGDDDEVRDALDLIRRRLDL